MQKGMDVRDRITTPAIHMPPNHVSKAEFLERAADVFLAEQMQVQRMQAAMQSGAGQPMFIDGPGDCNQQ